MRPVTLRIGIVVLALGGSVRAAGPPAVPRDAVGDPLPAGVHLRLGTVRFRAGLFVGRGGPAIVLAPDGTRMACASGDGAVWLCRADTGRRERLLSEPRKRHWPAAFSGDGRWLATGVDDGDAVLWEVATGRRLCRLFVSWGLSAPGTSIALRLPEKQIAVWNGTDEVSLHELAEGRPAVRVWRVPVSGDGKFSPDGRSLFVTGENGYCLVDVGTGRVRRIEHPLTTPRWSAWSPDSKYLAVTEEDTSDVQVVDGATGKLRARLSPAGHPATIPAWCGDQLAVGHQAGITLFDVPRQRPIRTLAWPREEVGNLLFRDGRHLFVVGPGGGISVLDPDTGTTRPEPAGPRGAVVQVAFSGDGRTLVSLGSDGGLDVWDPATGKHRRHIQSAGQGWSSLFVSVDGRRVSCTVPGSLLDPALVTLNTGNGRLVGELQNLEAELERAGERARPPRFAVSQDGTQLATPVTLWEWEGEDLRSAVDVVRVEDGRVLGVFAGAGFDRPRFSPDGRYLAVTATRKQRRLLQVLDLETRRTAFKLTGLPLPREADIVRGGRGHRSTITLNNLPAETADDFSPPAFSPDGRTIAVTAGGHLYLWEWGVSRPVSRQSLPRGFEAEQIRMTPDGRTLVLGWLRGTAQSPRAYAGAGVWDVDARRFLIVVKGSSPSTSVIALSPDGRLLATGEVDATVSLRHVPLPASRTTPLSLERGERLWGDLMGSHPSRAYRARLKLTVAGASAVGLLKNRLRPAPAVAAPTWLAELDGEGYGQRISAERQVRRLLARGDAVTEELLREALRRPASLELALRIERLLRERPPRCWTTAERGVIRAIQVLEAIGTPEAAGVLRRLAAGGPALQTREARASLERLAAR